MSQTRIPKAQLDTTLVDTTSAQTVQNKTFDATSTYPTFNQSTTGNAATATALQTARTIQTSLSSTSSASFNGTANITPGVTGTLAATNGGTGNATYAIGDILYASTTSALSRLADTATGNALISGGAGVAPSWGKIGLTTHISGVLPVANGGTNASSASITAFNNITGYTATGATGTTSTNLVFSTSPTITTPNIGQINDTNGNPYIISSPQVSSVNQLTIANATTGSGPSISATGTDTNIPLTLVAKGSGSVRLTNSNGLDIIGASSAPSAPLSGLGRFYTIGSTTVRPHFMNSGGVDETIVTDAGNIWTTWTPTWTGLTLGNGTVTAQYVRIGNGVWFRLYLLWGSTTAASSSANSFSLPLTASSFGGVSGANIGNSKMYDGTNQFEGPLPLTSTTMVTFRWFQVQGSGIKDANVTNAAPNSWITNNEWYAQGYYQAA